MAGDPISHPPRPLSRSEALRKLIHLGAGLPAFFLRDFGLAAGVGAALFGLGLAALFHHARFRFLWREHERGRRLLPALWLYPLSCLALVLVFRDRLELAAAGWGLLAVGDGVSTLAGRAFGGPRLPWNPAKTWAGSVAGFAAAAPCAIFLLSWTAPERFPLAPALVAGTLAAFVAMLAESYPSGLDDNLTLPLATGSVLAVLSAVVTAPSAGLDLVLVARGFALSLTLALAGLALRVMSLSGAVAGTLLSTAVVAGLGLPGLVLVAAFVITASALTRLGYARKAALGLAEARGGRRSARNAIANLSVAAGCALAAGLSSDRALFTLAFAGALAAGLADTAGTEVGKLWGRRVYSPLSGRRLEPGTPGGVSAAGLLATAGGALLIAGAAVGLELVPARQGAVLALAGVAGALAESLLATALGPARHLDHEASNAFNTLVGACVAAMLV